MLTVTPVDFGPVEVRTMAEVRLVAFAWIARRVAEAVVPAYKSTYSKRVFTQPQLLAVLCLMRYEDHGLDNRTTSSPSSKALNLIHVFVFWKVNVDVVLLRYVHS
jgi:hypothetical protein